MVLLEGLAAQPFPTSLHPSYESGIPHILNSCLPLGKILDTLLGCLSCHSSEINHSQRLLSPWLPGRPCFPW